MLLSVLFVSGIWAACDKPADLFVTTPKKMEALHGSCLQIPCNFSAKSDHQFDGSGENFGVWIKNDSRFALDPSNVIFNSSLTVNRYPMSFTGILGNKNCTTVFSNLVTSYTNTYFFRFEGKPTATASCDPLQITVKDSPPSPRIDILDDLKEKVSVTITCSAATPCPRSPPQLTWNLQQNSRNKMEENTDRTFTTKIQETISLSDQHDGFNLTCSVRYPVNEGKAFKTAEARKTLSVSYAPKETSVSIRPSGSWVNLSCSSRAKPPVSRFAWFKKSKEGDTKVFEGRVYSLNVSDGGVYYCEATNDLGSQPSSQHSLTSEGAKQPGSSWGAVVGVIIGIAVLISAVVAIWWFKSKHSTSQQTQVLTGGGLAAQEPGRTTEREDIHYGEIIFPTGRPEPTSVSVQDSRKQQDALYAQVKIDGKMENSLTESVYAQVKKK